MAVQLVNFFHRLIHRIKIMSAHIKKYITVNALDIKTLDEEVNRLLQQGFEPYGPQYYVEWCIEGVVERRFLQPMVTEGA